MRECTISIAAWSLIFLGGASPERAPAPREAAAPSVDSRFTEDLLKVGAGYLKWGRVDDEARWAPFLCRRPLPA